MKISVTKEDIKKGRRYEANRCPIASAVKRALKLKHVEILQLPGRENYAIVIDLPKNAQRFIDKYDDFVIPHGVVKPFTFKLTPKR